jgi:hypothetical protein
MLRRRWLGLRTLLLVVAMLCLAMAAAVGATPTAHASGAGPCSPLTADDLAQPQVTYRGHASAHLSRTAGTGGTLLTLTGSGWPAKASVGLDIWADLSGQFRGGSFNVPPVTTSEDGSLPTLVFRLPSGDYSPCINGMRLNGVPLDHVTILFVAHTLESDFRNVRARVPLIFTYSNSPGFAFPSANNTFFGGDAPAGASIPITSGGWAPGERITISPIITAWPASNPVGARTTPINTPGGVQGAFTMTADTHGAFNVPYHLPAVAPATTVSFWVHADDARFGDIGFFASASFFILPATYPSLQLAQRTLVAGGTLTLAGDHWLPNQQGVIEYCRGLAYDTSHALYCNRYVTQTLGAFTTDSTGHFFAQVHLPINARLGDITVQAHIGDPSVIMSSESRVFAQAEPLTIVSVVTPLTYAQMHPRRVWLLAHAPYLAGGALAALAGLLIALRRRHAGAQPAA